jgi:hypothetical protein
MKDLKEFIGTVLLIIGSCTLGLITGMGYIYILTGSI